MNLLQEASDAGDRTAKTQLALLYLSPEHGQRDLGQAENLLLDAAASGSPEASLHLGHFYSGQFDRATARPDQAARHYLAAAELGNVVAQHIVGTLMSSGNASGRSARTGRRNGSGARRTPASRRRNSSSACCTAPGEGSRKISERRCAGMNWPPPTGMNGHVQSRRDAFQGMGVEADPARGDAIDARSPGSCGKPKTARPPRRAVSIFPKSCRLFGQEYALKQIIRDFFRFRRNGNRSQTTVRTPPGVKAWAAVSREEAEPFQFRWSNCAR